MEKPPGGSTGLTETLEVGVVLEASEEREFVVPVLEFCEVCVRDVVVAGTCEVVGAFVVP